MRMAFEAAIVLVSSNDGLEDPRRVCGGRAREPACRGNSGGRRFTVTSPDQRTGESNSPARAARRRLYMEASQAAQ